MTSAHHPDDAVAGPTRADPALEYTIKPPKALMRAMGRAIHDYQMIRAGDRLLLGLSGGKDSLSLLYLLLWLQRYAPVRFELGAVTVDPLVAGFDPSPLKETLATLGVPYFYRTQAIMQQALQHMGNDSFCAYCARMKRGVMYATAREEGYQVLVLAQHLDDLAESFLMSVCFGGKLRTMRAHYRIEAGDLRVVRPLVYVRERQLAEFARAAGLAVIHDNCPACFRRPTQREHMKALLRAEESSNHRLFKSLLSAMQPLMRDATEPAP